MMDQRRKNLIIIRKHEIKNIACGLLSTFVSRNNDVLGYWGIGKLHGLMIQTKTLEITIDLINHTMIPHAPTFQLMVKYYSERLQESLIKRMGSFSLLQQAIIKLTLFPDDRSLKPRVQSKERRMHCQIILLDILDREYFFSLDAWSWPVSPMLVSTHYTKSRFLL